MAETIEVNVAFEEGSWQLIDATPVGPGQYRLEVTPLMVDVDVAFGDIIEVETLADGTLRYLGTVKRADLRHHDWILPHDVSESVELEAYCAKVLQAGGMWERVFGGLLIVHLPSQSSFDPVSALGEVFEHVRKTDRVTTVAKDVSSG